MRRKRRRAALFAAGILAGLAMMTGEMDAQNISAPDRGQARSMVISRNGIVAAESPLAAQAGVEMLERGGTAADAAVAANAMLGLVAPMSNGIGGDLFAIVYDGKTGKLYGLNASGWAPAGLSIEFLRSKGFRSMPERGIHSVTVPGAVDGWQRLLERFGRKKLAEVLAPAIRAADEGFPVTELVGGIWGRSVDLLRANDNAAQTYLITDRAPRVGELFRNRDLAWSYRQIAAQGRDAFYKGEIARRLFELSRHHGGTMTIKDLADHSGEWVDPISITYRDWTVYEMPPNGQGIAALEMLNLMESFPLGQFGPNSTRALHVMIEAKKLAYADLVRYIGDPQRAKLPVAGLIAKDYARERAKLIDMNKANCAVEPGAPAAPPQGGDTIYLSVVDREGNMVSLIQSNFEAFGSGLVADGTGFVLHDRGALFSLDPASPNALAGRKRPLHTIIPAFMQKGDVRIAFGIMGAWNQSQAHAQFVANIVDFKMNIQAALEAARFTKLTFGGCDVAMEGRTPGNIRNELTAKGHMIEVRGVFSPQMGGGQAVQRDFAAGINYGASDPRKDGAAIPEIPPEK
ncbi:MAG: gamma-glutamyltransferase [Candidatus Acidiferrales bacterium]